MSHPLIVPSFKFVQYKYERWWGGSGSKGPEPLRSHGSCDLGGPAAVAHNPCKQPQGVDHETPSSRHRACRQRCVAFGRPAGADPTCRAAGRAAAIPQHDLLRHQRRRAVRRQLRRPRGADRHCQTLAAKAGAGGKTWRAYLSTQAVGGATAVNARDRIGKGPWVNAKGVQIASSVGDLHSANNKIAAETIVAETGRLIPSRLYTVNQHDVLTGSQADGTAFAPDKDMTCGNWTKSGEGNAMLGHADRMGLRDDDASKSWNTSHPSRACDAASLVATGGAGLLYCFAAN